MKKLLLIFLTVALLSTMVGCGQKAPVRFEPKQLLFTENGTQEMKVINESDEGIVLHLHWDVAPSGVSCYANDTIYLIPREEKEVEVEVFLNTERSATVTPEPFGWNRAMNVPGRQKINVPSMRSATLMRIYPITVIRCYYVNELDKALWVWLDTKLEPKPDDIFASASSSSAISAVKIEPGEVRWFEIDIKPSSKVKKSSEHRVTLVVNVEKCLWEPKWAGSTRDEMQEYWDWSKERKKTPTKYPVELILRIEEPGRVKLREDYIFSCHYVYLDAGETFSKTLHFENHGASREIAITTGLENKSVNRPDIPIEVTIEPQRQVFWRWKVTSVDLKIKAPDMKFDREMKYNYYYYYLNQVTLTLTAVREVSEEEGPIE